MFRIMIFLYGAPYMVDETPFQTFETCMEEVVDRKANPSPTNIYSSENVAMECMNLVDIHNFELNMKLKKELDQ